MASELSAPPVLSTPAENVFEQHTHVATSDANGVPGRSDDDLVDVYEIQRTAKELIAGGWRRIGLQFPDSMLQDAPKVVAALQGELESAGTEASGSGEATSESRQARRIYILADTSYSACCVDEIAAEHVHVEAVVHYGRSCLSPTSRLPVIYIFTKHQLDHNAVLGAFEKEFSDKESKVVLMADVTRQDHLPSLAAKLVSRGYGKLLSTAVVHKPTATLPNRNLVDAQGTERSGDLSQEIDVSEYSVFHISEPPTALLLALSSRVKALHVLPTTTTTETSTTISSAQTTRRLLGRRYARLLSLASAGTIGILVNTLSVSNYLKSLDSIRAQIAAAGKKSYTVVVGKLNPAKLANFAEVEGWVVVGCWESSLVEDDGNFFQPVITPFELEAALAGDDNRVWGGEWWGGIELIGEPKKDEGVADTAGSISEAPKDTMEPTGEELDPGEVDEEESEPPEFDLRTGKLISHSRPMRSKLAARQPDSATTNPSGDSTSLTLRAKSELATVKGIVSPGAEYLRSQRTWQGLGTDFADTEASSAIEEGRSGVARGYTLGENGDKR